MLSPTCLYAEKWTATANLLFDDPIESYPVNVVSIPEVWSISQVDSEQLEQVTMSK